MRLRTLCAVAVVATGLTFVSSASALVCPRGTQEYKVYHPITHAYVVTICVIPQQ
jgi:hypothetical protein